jgi:PAS domain S-box-containing protein
MVEDGESAWRMLNSPEAPRLAILDWVMPGADGIEVCRRVRAATLPHYVYIVLLTGKAGEKDLLAGLEAGSDDYLCKPVNFHQLKLRLRAAERVLTAERRYRLIAEVASDGIVTMNASGVVQFANHSAGTIFGMPAGELVGQPFADLAPGFGGQEQLRDGEAAAQQGGATRSWAPMELLGRHRTGKLVPLEVSFGETVEGTHEPLITMVIRNVTERKVRENHRAHVQKLESIGHLAAGVAHEINTPMQYIGDNLRFIQDSFRATSRMMDAYRRAMEDSSLTIADSPRVSELNTLAASIDLDYLSRETPQAIEQAVEGAERVGEIVRALREFSHPGTLETAPADLNRLLENVALVSRNRWKYVAELTTDLDADLPEVKCLAGELRQVFLNLIVNAADAIAEAFKDRPDQKGELRVTSRRDGDFAEVRIRDNGTGIPKDARAKVFDPFFTTKPIGSGTGQGLSIAYGIVTRKHRGSIEFDTQEGVGTTFTVRLPIDGRESQRPLAVKTSVRVFGGRRPRALGAPPSTVCDRAVEVRA